jgi:hypothetical protein
MDWRPTASRSIPSPTVGIAAIFYNRFDLRIASDTLLILFDAADRVRHIGVRRAPPLDP